MKLSNRLTPVSFWPMELEGFFDQLSKPRNGYTPRTNIEETDSSFVVEMELPGVESDAVNVEVTEGRLTISGEKKSVEETQDKNFHRIERVSGSFERSFEFPTQVDFEKIEAAFDKGVLTITLPKSEKVLPRKIEIKSS